MGLAENQWLMVACVELFDLRRGISFAFADGSELFFPFSKSKREATDAQVSVLTVANAVPRALNKQRGFDLALP